MGYSWRRLGIIVHVLIILQVDSDS